MSAANCTVGGGTGFLLQIWWLDFDLETDIFDNFEQHGIDPMDNEIVPFPAVMVDLDAALGAGIGLAYNTIGLGCHRLWLRFYAGAGGGLAISACAIQLCGNIPF